MLKRILSVLGIFLSIFLKGQTCTVSVSSNVTCVNNATTFSVSFLPTTLTPTSYEWNFGNGVLNTQANPTYNYPLAGTFTPSVKVNFSNGSQCIVNGSAVQVFSLPIADFVITTPTTQCFKGNSVCVTDKSTPGPSASPLTLRTFLWGDGAFDNTPITNKNLCHTYTNTLGSTNSLVVEVTDNNGCVARHEIKSAVTIFPRPDPISFITQYTVKCDSTPVTFLNSSIMPLANVKSFTWDFGDGTKDVSSTKWNNFVYTYTKGGFFTPVLYIVDKNDCRDTFELLNGAQNLKLDNKITVTSVSKCFSNQNYVFSVPGSLGADVYWAIYDEKGKLFDTTGFPTISYGQSPDKKFNCGFYTVKCYASLGGCKKYIDTIVEVFGPNTILANDTVRPKFEAQCKPDSIVYFRVPPPELSCFYKNVTDWLWDFGDNYAPACTTDTKNGINVGVNCRYSKDSINVKHKYDPTKPGCYKAKLTIKDPIRGCSDEDSVNIILNSPNAKPDLPSRRGLYYFTLPPGRTGPPVNCYESIFVFDYKETLPDCGRERVWINFDSTAGINNFDSVYAKIDTVIHFYNPWVADSNGWVTVGLIIKNGNCYDTAWYHKMFQILRLDPAFTIKVDSNCPPYRVTITLKDSIQDSLTTATFRFSGIADSVQVFSLTEKVIKSKSFIVNSMGIKNISVTLENRKGCSRTRDTIIYLGYYKDLLVPKTVYCLKDSVQFFENIDYYSFSTSNWYKTNRFNANLEQTWWNLDDGNGFVRLKNKPKHKFDKIGSYKIKMAVQDSLGCKDTITYPVNIKVVDIKAGIKTITTDLICAPKIIPLQDSSTIIDVSAANGDLPYDKEVSWFWDFGDKKAISLLENPIHDYTTNDTFYLKHKVTSQNGCSDSITIPVIMRGPRPKYEFLSGDSVGCKPVKFNMANTTGSQLQSWQWTFNGPDNFIVSTDKDTNCTFVLNKAGKYRLLLLGTDAVTSLVTGVTVFCTSVFPDTLNPNSKPVYITVYDKPLVKLTGPDSVCQNEPFTIIAKPDTLYYQYFWNISNGFKSTVKPTSDTTLNYIFNDSGAFTIKYIPTPKINIPCIDTAEHIIYVKSIKADFDVDQSQTPLYQFNNKSISAVSHFWDFGDKNSPLNNTSTEVNPSHNYQTLNDTFKVCLVVKNIQNCFDTMCKFIYPDAKLLRIPNVFTPNGDGNNDAFDIEIIAQSFYDLKIYNRWGNEVYESQRDGVANDGINWNGKKDNAGLTLPTGVYFYVFNYKLAPSDGIKTVRGTVTLLKD